MDLAKLLDTGPYTKLNCISTYWQQTKRKGNLYIFTQHQKYQIFGNKSNENTKIQ